MQLPRQLAGFARPSGVIKGDYEDFVVDEVPLYNPQGSGTHTYFLMQKAGLSTAQAVNDIAIALNVRRRDIGFAGLKDARAVTRQWLSIEHVDPERVRSLVIPRIDILEVSQHRNKLRIGHLAGNRFQIRVRQTAVERIAELQDQLAELARLGVPNSFGEQRFGTRGDTWKIGRAIIKRRPDEAVDLTLGRPAATDHGSVRRARELYESGHYGEAIRHWPSMFREQRQALRALVRSHGKKQRALHAIDKRTRQFYVSAYQSYLFNRVVAERIAGGLGRLMDGDLAWIHHNGAVFRVHAANDEQARADAWEISPSGPLFGPRMTQAEGAVGELEARILAGEGLASDAFGAVKLNVKGGRRPLRFRLSDAKIGLGADHAGAYLELCFTLPRGCYATNVLWELFDVRAGGPTKPEREEPEA